MAKQERPFHPHVTIAGRDLKERDFATAWAYFQSQTYEAAFEANAISLLVNTDTGWEIEADCPFW